MGIDKIVEKRYVTYSSSLINYLINELGYKLTSNKGSGLNTVKIFTHKTIPGKQIEIKANSLTLYLLGPDNNRRVFYTGYTISENILDFFTKRGN